MKGETFTCERCGLPQRSSCDGKGTELAKAKAYTRCENDRQIEVDSSPLRKKHGFLTWSRVTGTAKSWKGKQYLVFYVGNNSNSNVIVRPTRGGKNLLLKKKSLFESIEAQVGEI